MGATIIQTATPTGDTFLDGYARVEVTATYRYSSDLDLLLSADNLFDE